ncbi:HD domain-containing protein [Chengkuizengella marina]|uniref:HD domain-containing protein n=1 Tax=Chengkuizengella marina TaxID=2507566 RepID=A0A6N9Q8C0_9BACL|nr:HD domain-containing protein [Chengkuizengella marina]NBI30941.1 HD domain-containing protein [Chengkuizengella marina]
MNARLKQQMEFIIEIDKLKTILRQTNVIGETRQENDAEHSWHLAMMCMVFYEYANENAVNMLRVLKMLLIHDIVEIDAGDTFAYDDKGHEDKREREELAAKRLFHLLPLDQAQEFIQLWKEYENRDTPESRFALALDRLQPMLLNYHNQGAVWQKHHVTGERVYNRNKIMAEGSETLWEYAEKLIRDALDKGYLLT